jgi:alginate O-acetyltransferase complex protein AlgI
MLFNSPLFIFLFLPLFYLLYFALPGRFRNTVILLASIFFYTWGEPRFIIVVLFSALLDFLITVRMCRASQPAAKKAWLILSVTLNVGLLFYFKYFNFFVTTMGTLLASLHLSHLRTLNILLPLAISFVVFEKITYVVDVYRGVSKPASSLLSYMTYVMIFPKLIAGPIIKFHDIADQIASRTIGSDDLIEGFCRFAKGLAKKVIIADTMAEVVDFVFALPPETLGFRDSWLGVLCFSIQIFFDFSGYSDMAIGLLRTMGFKVMENFNMPYISQSFTEFWRRWHISLSTFIRDYIYVPLGGSRCPKYRQYLNLLICFIISGLWHGAQWTFLIWGIYHGFFLTLDRMLAIRPGGRRTAPSFINVLGTFMLVTLGWTIFRAQNLEQIGYYLVALVSPAKTIFSFAPYLTGNIICYIFVGLLISMVPATRIYESIRTCYSPLNARYGLHFVSAVALFILSVGKTAALNFSSFIYFRF